MYNTAMTRQNMHGQGHVSMALFDPVLPIRVQPEGFISVALSTNITTRTMNNHSLYIMYTHTRLVLWTLLHEEKKLQKLRVLKLKLETQHSVYMYGNRNFLARKIEVCLNVFSL